VGEYKRLDRFLWHKGYSVSLFSEASMKMAGCGRRAEHDTLKELNISVPETQLVWLSATCQIRAANDGESLERELGNGILGDDPYGDASGRASGKKSKGASGSCSTSRAQVHEAANLDADKLKLQQSHTTRARAAADAAAEDAPSEPPALGQQLANLDKDLAHLRKQCDGIQFHKKLVTEKMARLSQERAHLNMLDMA
jgi:hypothetical protein